MAGMKNISLAFLDGLSPLDSLFGRVERPGSRENLINDLHYPSVDHQLLTDASTEIRGAQLEDARRTLALSLRALASRIEDAKPVESVHGH